MLAPLLTSPSPDMGKGYDAEGLIYTHELEGLQHKYHASHAAFVSVHLNGDTIISACAAGPSRFRLRSTMQLLFIHSLLSLEQRRHPLTV